MDDYGKKKKKMRGKKAGELNGVELEKGDTMAIIIAAMTTIVPFTLFIIFLFYLFAKWFFKF